MCLDLLPDLLMWRPHHVSPRLRWVSALSLCVADPGVTRRYRQRAPLPLTAGLLRGAPGEALGNLGQSRAAISLGRPRARVDAGRSIDVFVYVLHTRMRRPVNSGRNASTPAIHYNRRPTSFAIAPSKYLFFHLSMGWRAETHSYALGLRRWIRFSPNNYTTL